MSHFVSSACAGEVCNFRIGIGGACGTPATHKVGEEIMHDDPNPARHNLVAYLCCHHFARVVGQVCQ